MGNEPLENPHEPCYRTTLSSMQTCQALLHAIKCTTLSAAPCQMLR